MFCDNIILETNPDSQDDYKYCLLVRLDVCVIWRQDISSNTHIL